MDGVAKRSAIRPALSLKKFLALAGVSTALLNPLPFSEAKPHQAGSEKSRQALDEKKVTGPYVLVVSLAKQHVYIYNRDGLLTKSAISSGKPGHGTPSGIFTILGKERFHRSNLYSAAPMPFMQRITWSGVALHAGVVPGYPASHGCVRLPAEFAKRLYGITQGHERVLITRTEIEPKAISNSHLPVPYLYPSPASEALMSHVSLDMMTPSVTPNTPTEGKPQEPAKTIEVVAKADQATTAQQNTAAEEKRLNPIDYARLMRKQTSSKIEAAQAGKKQAKLAALSEEKQLGTATVELRKADAAFRAAMDRVNELERKIAKSKDVDILQEVNTAKTAAQVIVSDVQSRVDTAQTAKEQQAQKVSSAEQAADAADSQVKTAVTEHDAWARRLEPVSIFISRKTGKIYVRQKQEKVLEAAITIKNPQAPIGTHVFVAMNADVNANNTPDVKWLAFSFAVPAADDEERKSHRHKGKDEPTSEQAHLAPSTAAEALDRLEIPADINTKISELVWSGASLIISDNGLSDETDNSTDFIVTTRF